MEELVALTCVEPSDDLDERTRFKYPNIACELLTCDVPVLNERLAGDEALLTRLYSFLNSEPPLNPLLASFFSKIMGVLIAKKNDQVGNDFILTLIINHYHLEVLLGKLFGKSGKVVELCWGFQK